MSTVLGLVDCVLEVICIWAGLLKEKAAIM